MTFLDIPVDAWFTHGAIYDKAVAGAHDGALFVEVGCFLGRSTAYLAQRIKESEKRIRLVCVDTWDNATADPGDQMAQNNALHDCGCKPESLYGRFITNMLACGVDRFVDTLQMKSVDAAATFADGSIDFCFIDASHDYPSIRDDLAMWLPRVKPGGYIGGHDYRNGHVGVDKAVEERLPVSEVIAEHQSFLWRKH